MKFYSYIKEGSRFNTAAFWVSPKGEVIGSYKKHINMVLEKPEKFGLTKEELRKFYESYGEPLGHEGRAREEIIKRLMRKKWIRIRKWPNKFYSVQFFHKSMYKRKYLQEWAFEMLNKGVSGFKETDKYFPVILMDLGQYREETTISDLANEINESNTIILCNKLNELETIPLYEDF
jgi:hypothetical protein